MPVEVAERLLVLGSSVCAVSRSTIRPSEVRVAKWPPLRSEGVRRTASIANGAPEAANQPATAASGTAPRLSELDTNTWVKPASMSRSSSPVPRSAV